MPGRAIDIGPIGMIVIMVITVKAVVTPNMRRTGICRAIGFPSRGTVMYGWTMGRRTMHRRTVNGWPVDRRSIARRSVDGWSCNRWSRSRGPYLLRRAHLGALCRWRGARLGALHLRTLLRGLCRATGAILGSSPGTNAGCQKKIANSQDDQSKKRQNELSHETGFWITDQMAATGVFKVKYFFPADIWV
jgi:hypothetical protein